MTTETSHAERAHSERGASSAHRWIACSGSVNAQRGRDDPGSEPAREGTAAHEVSDLCLKQGMDAIEFVGRMIVVGNHQIECTEEMALHVQVYVDYVRSRETSSTETLIEHGFDVSDVLREGMFGTNDASVYDRATGVLEVIDFKYGFGVVEPEENPQLIYYGIGALTKGEGRWVSAVKLTIVQPRAPHRQGPVRSWTTEPFTLVEWIDKLQAAADATDDPNAPRTAGEHCTFCKAAGDCGTLRARAKEVARMEFADFPDQLDDPTIAAILEDADIVSTWVNAVKAEAYRRAVAGEKIPGYKLVPKRAIRKWDMDDADFLAPILMQQFDLPEDAPIYSPRKLKTPAQLEKLLPPKRRAELEEFYDKTSSGFNLAREADAREEVSAEGRSSAQDDF